MPTNRPVIRDLERSPIDTAIEVITLLEVIVLVALPAFYYSSLPETIPRHFNFKGEADGFGSKSSLLLTPAMGVVLYISMTVLSRFPHKHNYLWPITEENARRQYLISRQMVSALKMVGLSTFVYITWATIRTATGAQSGLSGFFAILLAPALFAVIGYYLLKGSRAQ